MTSPPLADLAAQKAELLDTISSLSTLDALREAEPAITGKRSILATLQKSLGSLEPDERRDAGAVDIRTELGEGVFNTQADGHIARRIAG